MTDYSYLNNELGYGPLDYKEFKNSFDAYYDCPIHEQIGALQTMMANEHDKTVLKAVQQIGIEIDQKGLIEAIHNDRHRYEEAYSKGYNDAKQQYEAQLKSVISKLKELIGDASGSDNGIMEK